MAIQSDRKSRFCAACAPVLLLVAGCQPPRDARSLPPRAGCAVEAGSAVRTELMFGLSRRDGTAISDDEFAAFFAAEVADRLDRGVTLVAAEGRYRDRHGALVAERTKLLIWLHAESARNEQAIEAVRAMYKQRFDQESVLRADSQSCVDY